LVRRKKKVPSLSAFTQSPLVFVKKKLRILYFLKRGLEALYCKLSTLFRIPYFHGFQVRKMLIYWPVNENKQFWKYDWEVDSIL